MGQKKEDVFIVRCVLVYRYTLLPNFHPFVLRTVYWVDGCQRTV